METSTTMNLFDAKLTAWGSSAANDPNLVCGQPLSENNPMTYSELFYWIALNSNEKGCNNKTEYEVCRILPYMLML